MVPLDSAVNIAFPDITGSFGLPIAMIQWVVICYVLTHAGLMLAFGRIGDIWGHARVFRAGLAVERHRLSAVRGGAELSAGCCSRGFLQGIGAGLVISCAPVLVTSLYPEARRSHAVGDLHADLSLGLGAGPLIGGVLVARWGWPAVFWFRAPIALAGLMLWRGLPRAAAGGSGERFDIAGAVLLATGLVSLLFAVNALAACSAPAIIAPCRQAPSRWRALPPLSGGRGGRRGPMVRIDLFRDPPVRLDQSCPTS